MKTWIIRITFLVLAILLGIGIQKYAVQESKEKEPLYWVAPMDPTFRSDKPGKSPMGMDLVPVYEDSATDMPGTIEISPVVVNSLGVRTETVKREDIVHQIDTVGYVIADENQISQIHSYIDGWVEELLVKTLGEEVSEGQPLLALYSPTLVSAQEEFIIAQKSHNTTLIEAAIRKLRTLGMTEEQIETLRSNQQVERLIKLYAPQDGIVANLNIREGIYIMPDQNLMTLEDLSQIWIITEIFERQAYWVEEGQRAVATLPYLPGQEWEGIVEYVYPELDVDTHTLRLRLSFANPELRLKPNMYANVKILASPEKDALSISKEALIRTGEGNRVIVALGEGRFQVRPVKVGAEAGNRIVILSGLEAGEKIVSSGQFLIDSEASLKASLQRLDQGEDGSMPHRGH